MKLKTYTRTLVALCVVSAAAAPRAEEQATPLLTALPATTLSGYVDTSAVWLPGPGSTNALPGRSFDGADKQNGFNLNVVSLVLEKPLDESDWAAGYRVQLLFGPDANTLRSLSTLGTASGDFAIKNAYVSLRAPVGRGLTLKMGVWDTIMGHEVFESGNNPNYSRSYGYFIEPIIHTGVLASYELMDGVTLSAGVADGGGSNSINARSGIDSVMSYVGSIALSAPESWGALSGTTLYLGAMDSGRQGAKDMINWFAGLTVPLPWEGWSVGAAYDYRAHGLFDGSYENATGLYVMWQASEKLKLSTRAEYATGSAGAYGYAGSNPVQLFGLTGTLAYALWPNTLSRLELRWDHDLNSRGEFLNGLANNAVSLALNVIYQF
ncbi:outer membrane beta-barrel protein [Limisphaera sp. VF-2]|uniref:outer membrane beta-barrel protein n=1 Tax=Limisphaera sp. VF-2 TaxID=3400418 RepID=UPI003C161E19